MAFKLQLMKPFAGFMILMTVAACSGRSQKQVEVAKRAAASPTPQPQVDQRPPVDQQRPPAPGVVQPPPAITPLPTPAPTAVPVTPVTPVVTPDPSASTTTNAVITATLPDGTTQQVEWDGRSDRGNDRWTIQTVQ